MAAKTGSPRSAITSLARADTHDEEDALSSDDGVPDPPRNSQLSEQGKSWLSQSDTIDANGKPCSRRKPIKSKRRVFRALCSQQNASVNSQNGSTPATYQSQSNRSTHRTRQLTRRPFANATKHVELCRDRFQVASTSLHDPHCFWQDGALRHAFQCMMDGDIVSASNLLQSFIVMFLRPGFFETNSRAYIRLTIDALVHNPDRNKDFDFLDSILKVKFNWKHFTLNRTSMHANGWWSLPSAC